MMEKNKEEIERLEREAARELDCYKLVMYKQSNGEFKKETNKIRVDERKRTEKLEAEWIAKMETKGNVFDIEMKGVRMEHKQRAVMVKRQFNAGRQKCIDEYGAVQEEAQVNGSRQMEQLRVRHEREMTDMEDEYSERLRQKLKSCEG